MKAGHCGSRIYNLFPTLLGSAEAWEEYLPRVAEMGFDWSGGRVVFPPPCSPTDSTRSS
jgi:hypothetical protein